ncbi:hypothetical protein Micbo1qcDRAFT_155322, partial [Microdochium bolleyi]
MYLTPPDGVPNVAAATPSLDGLNSSPANHTSVMAPVDNTSQSTPLQPDAAS